MKRVAREEARSWGIVVICLLIFFGIYGTRQVAHEAEKSLPPIIADDGRYQ